MYIPVVLHGLSLIRSGLKKSSIRVGKTCRNPDTLFKRACCSWNSSKSNLLDWTCWEVTALCVFSPWTDMQVVRYQTPARAAACRSGVLQQLGHGASGHPASWSQQGCFHGSTGHTGWGLWGQGNQIKQLSENIFWVLILSGCALLKQLIIFIN